MTTRGYQLRQPSDGKNETAAAVFVDTLEEAAALIRAGYLIRMTPPGEARTSYLSLKSLALT
jgi:hypothetical protein